MPQIIEFSLTILPTNSQRIKNEHFEPIIKGNILILKLLYNRHALCFFILMLKNYLKVAWRYLLHNRASTLINVGGLSIGMTVAILIGLWVYDELSFNKYHENYDRIGKIMIHNGDATEMTSTFDEHPFPLAAALRSA